MYAVLCDCAAYYKADRCYPSHKKLAEKLSCSISSVKRYLAELSSAKLISIEFREQTSNIYYLLKHDLLTGYSNTDCGESQVRQQLQVGSCESEIPPQQANVTSPKCKVNPLHFKMNCESNHTKQEEKKNPPLPPVHPEQPRGAAASGTPPAGGEGSFFADFETLWEAYPKKEALDGARAMWRKMRKSGLLPSLPDLLAAIKRFMGTTQWQKDHGRYIPQLLNFLKKRLWLDPLSNEELEVNRKRLEAERLEGARKQAEEAEAARSREKRERLRPVFDAFTERFSAKARQANERQNAMRFGTWMYHYAKYHGPTAADVLEGADCDIMEFLDAYKRQREADAYRATHQATRRAAPRETLPSRDFRSDNRERKPVLCADILCGGNLLERFLPAPQTLYAAV